MSMSAFGVDHGEISKGVTRQMFSGNNLANKGTLIKLKNGGPWATKKGTKVPDYQARRGVPTQGYVKHILDNHKASTVL